MASFLTEAGASKVVLFGSLTRSDRFTPRSDIDLAVEGIDWSTYWRILSKLHRMSVFNVDLVVLEDADPEFRQRILQEGKDLSQ
ncbi:MAG: nucleotidyltransferase domain-containing protein [Firmicutes bacterium]|nr:nucleotidyltransferase domain-containing protein [Bacillota bacterium]